MKKIQITIIDGKLQTDNDAKFLANDTENLGLKEIAIIIESLKKEQEKIMNRVKESVTSAMGKTSPHMYFVKVGVKEIGGWNIPVHLVDTHNNTAAHFTLRNAGCFESVDLSQANFKRIRSFKEYKRCA